MTPDEFKEGVASYVLGGLEPEDEERFDRFLSQGADAESRELLHQARRAAQALDRSLPPVRPSQRVWTGIEAKLDASSPEPSSLNWGRIVPWAVAATLLLATLLTNQQVAQLIAEVDDIKGEHQSELEARDALALSTASVLEMVADPRARTIALKPVAGATGSAALVLHPERKVCMIFGSDLAVLTQRHYVVWLIRAGTPANIGTLPIGEHGMGMRALDYERLAHTGHTIAVTVETDADVAEPTTTPVLAATL